MQPPAFFTQPPIELEIRFSGPFACSQRALVAARSVQGMHVQSNLTGFTHAMARRSGKLVAGR